MYYYYTILYFCYYKKKFCFVTVTGAILRRRRRSPARAERSPRRRDGVNGWGEGKSRAMQIHAWMDGEGGGVGGGCERDMRGYVNWVSPKAATLGHHRQRGLGPTPLSSADQ
ncbi:hypothetical protein DAI22_12g199101 [Oryza sativa Japonica Group]|nr:hypothetical protein DAI22_12g199101 [Oryza sativa Japonica Group]